VKAFNWRQKNGFHDRVQDREARIPTLDELEREHIIEVLDHTGWRVSGEKGAAKLLGMKPTTLEARMKKLGIKRNHK
jgi:formate hydrogenlyase transcriptional activator